MNGPEVIEQEAGIAELDASDRAGIWKLIGGEQRYATDLADALIDDDVEAIVARVRTAADGSVVSEPRSTAVATFLARLAQIDPDHPPEPQALRGSWARGGDHE
jgi:malonate decarboxylase beta subunit